MAKRLKLAEVEILAPRIKALIEQGKTKKQICEELDIYMGAVNAYLRYFAPKEIIKMLDLRGV